MQKAQIKNTEWLWGIHAVREAWQNPARIIHSLLVTDNSADVMAQWIAPKDAKRPKPDRVDRRVIDKRLPEGAVHQGVAVQCSPLEEIFLSDLIIRSKSADRMMLVMLDQVTDPHNVGAIMRSSCAFEGAGMIVQSRHAPEATGTMAKSACGAMEYMPMIREVNLSRAIDQLKDGGFTVLGLDEQGMDLRDYQSSATQLPTHVCLVLGAEGPGLRSKIKEHCSSLIRLPTGGSVPTLNVSNAAAVALYALSQK